MNEVAKPLSVKEDRHCFLEPPSRGVEAWHFLEDTLLSFVGVE